MKTGKFILLALLLTAAANGLAQDNQANHTYQEAYNLILDEKWSAAIPALERVVKDYPQSDWIDDARFWQCYAREKSDRDLESAFACYQDFLDNYPDSKWVKDAKANMIRLGERLERSGKREYGPRIRAMRGEKDEEVALAALMALQQMGDDKSLPVIIRLYDKTTNEAVREKIVFVLSQSEAPEAEKKLIEIAQSDKDTDVREKAVFWLGQRGDSKECFEALKAIAMNDADQDVREKAIFALSQVPDGKGMPVVIEIARKHSDPEMREKAVFWISQMDDNTAALKILTEILRQDPELDVREKALFALTQLSDDAGVPVLIEVAKKDPDQELRKKAIFWLGQTQDERARQALLEIIEGE